MMLRTAWSTMLPTTGSSNPARTSTVAVASDASDTSTRRGGHSGRGDDAAIVRERWAGRITTRVEWRKRSNAGGV